MSSGTRRSFRIGEVAEHTGVSVETLRYYERLGLLPKQPRTDGRERRFAPDQIDRVRFIKQAQTLGLTLRTIRELLGDTERTRTECRRVHDILTRQAEEVDRRIAELRQLRRTLDRYRKACAVALGGEAEPVCPAVDALIEKRRRA